MSDETSNKARVKIRLKTGEEFEAEGGEIFINRQRSEFLSIIGQPPSGAPARQQKFQQISPEKPTQFTAEQRAEYTPPSDFVLPKGMRSAPQPAGAAVTVNAAAVWNSAVREEGGAIVLRRKYKELSPALAALVITAAAKVLLNETPYTALKLAKSMKASGFMGPEDRLDRITSPEVKQGTLLSEGTKRNRAYKITDEGFARAFILAEKLI